MENSGAIPKAKGGARPKIKLITNEVTRRKDHDSGSLKSNSSFSGEADFRSNGSTTLIASRCKNERIVSLNRAMGYKHPQSTGIPNISPLEKREIVCTDEGVQLSRLALSPEWVERRIFIHYTRPPIATADGDYVIGAMDAWTEQMEFLTEDLTWLLNMPHHRFWSQMVYDKGIHECLQFYLMNGPRWYDSFPQDENFLAVISDIHQLIFLIYVRMATYKESKESYITPSVFGDLIYDNFLYDMCKILDLCILYGSANRTLLSKLIDNIFTYQPKYFNDLSQLASSLITVLKNLEEKLGIFDDSSTQCPLNIEVKFSIDELCDIVGYMLDTFCSLQVFLSIFPKACEIFHKKEFEQRLAFFYEKSIFKLFELLSSEEILKENPVRQKSLLEKVDTIRLSILSIFREILVQNCLQENVEEGECPTSSLSRRIGAFTYIFTSCAEEKIFITDYNTTYDLKKDLLIFKDRDADLTTLDFVKQAVDSIVSEMNSLTVSEVEVVPEEKQQLDTANDSSGMNGYYAGETSSLTSVEIESLISLVQDLLPDLGSGFIRECLNYYNYSSEEVLNAVLEGSLPPFLVSLDHTMKDSDKAKDKKQPLPRSHNLQIALQNEEPDVMVNRLNVYDDDEFDVFTQPAKFDLNKVRKGKSKNKRPELERRDPELNEKMKTIIHQYESNQGYSIYEDEEKYTAIVSAEYDDEYDDTYDDDEAGNVDSFSDDKKSKYGSIPTIRGRGALNTPAMNFLEEEQSEDEELSDGKLEGNARDGKFGDDDSNPNSKHRPTFKRANASIHRGNAMAAEQNWNSNSLAAFTNSGRPTRPDYSSEGANGSSSSKTCPENWEKDAGPRSSFVPFCENPADIRLRREMKRQHQQFRNKGYYPPPSNPGEQVSGSDPNSTSNHHLKTSTKTNKHSGKSWRQGPQGEDSDNPRRQGGKYKEDTNHGKAQDRNYKHKMVHKSDQRKQGAQFKYRSNF